MSLIGYIYSQFGRPRGILGRLAGHVMATRGSNRQRNAWTVGLLGLKPDDRFLEIGFGPGIAIGLAAEAITQGRIVGIDHSETMLNLATARNKEAVASGQVELLLGGLERLSGLGEPFTRAMSTNVVQFWKDPGAAYRSLAAVMAPGGVVATTYQPRHKGATAADAEAMAERISGWMAAAGFDGIRTERLPLEPLPAICVLGVKI